MHHHTVVKTAKMINQDYDYLWKAVLRLFIQDFIKFFFPDKYDEIDWSKGVEFLDRNEVKGF